MLDLSTLVTKALRKQDLYSGVQRRQALQIWREIAGSELAQLTRAQGVREGVLWVEVHDSVMANYLTMQRQPFLQRLRARLGHAIQDIRFVVGIWQDPVIPHHASPEPLSAQDQAELQSKVAILPEELRESAYNAAESVLRARRWRERQGWPRCAVCATPIPTAGICHPCDDLLGNPQVKQAASRLACDPDFSRFPHLSEHALEGARYLALQYLNSQMETLLIGVLAQHHHDYSYVQYLRATAQTYLRLKLMRPTEPLELADYRALPERVYHLLIASGVD